MTNWEYRAATIGSSVSGHDHKITDHMNLVAAGGWEIFAAHVLPGDTRVRVYMKRPVLEAASQRAREAERADWERFREGRADAQDGDDL